MSGSADTAKAVARRVGERRGLIERAAAYVSQLASRMPVAVAVVVGSVARGDFNLWSDTDLVLIVDGSLPTRVLDRLALTDDRPAGVEVILYSEEEFVDALRRRNRLALEAATSGVVLWGGDMLTSLRGREGPLVGM